MQSSSDGPSFNEGSLQSDTGETAAIDAQETASAEQQPPPGVDHEADTVVATNVDVMKLEESKRKLKSKLKKAEDELVRVRSSLSNEKAAKRKLYSSLVRIAKELNRTKAESEALVEAANYADRNWYEGGMWRAPALLPGVGDPGASANPQRKTRDPVSLSDLFLDLIVVTAFTRVGVAVQERGMVDGPILAYLAIFWFIWTKEASYSTRFDTTDLSSQVERLLTCFAVLFGSLSSNEPFASPDGTRIMLMAAFVAIMHFFLHLRVWFWFRETIAGSELHAVKMYGLFQMLMTGCETVIWIVGIFVLPEDWEYRWAVFLAGILLQLRVPKAFLANDFHAASSKRGVLFILLLGYILQGIVVKATPFFDYGDSPTPEQYAFLGAACFLLYAIKLLYVDDSFSIDPQDHALLVNRAAGFCFHVGQYFLLLSTVVLGAGMDLLTNSYLSATAALSNNSKALVCGGFACVVLAVLFIKSMHVRRVPIDPGQARLFYAAYVIQVVFVAAITFTSMMMCFAREGKLGYLMLNEIEMLSVLCGFALLLVIMSWLDEAVDLSLYGGGPEGREYRVQPFGLWWCLGSTDPDVEDLTEAASFGDGRLSHLAPLLGSSFNLSSGMIGGSVGGSGASITYQSTESLEGQKESSLKKKKKKSRSVSFDDANALV